ncbi:hypothetical protein JTB14_000827 [Gonioctena quinquepunctata]|nr:hypothetical protein JTB14_000827 [Gonioctena quinquepunctata]
MELDKYVIKNKYHSQTVYCPKSKSVDDKNYILLGFKNSFPVLCGKMNESKTTSVKKTLKIEVNPETGEKYITLNGKKLKIVPESKLPSQIPKNAQVRKIASINSSTSGSPVKVKILKGMPLKNSNFCITQYINKASEGNQITTEISNINGLSQKTLIKENELQNVKTLSSNMTINANTTDNISHTASMLGNKSINQNRTFQSVQSIRALDLTNYSSKENLSHGISEKVENSSQTDNVIETDKKTVDACVQTDEDLSLDDLIDLLPLEDISMPSFEAPCASKKVLTFSDIPNKKLLDLDSLPQQKTKNVTIQNEVAKNLFTELRIALQPDDKGNMPLHIGVVTNDLKMVKRSWFILKILKQSIDLRNNNDYTALQLAIIHDASTDIISFLLIKGASLSTTDIEGNNLVHLSIEYHRKDALEILLTYAEDIGSSLDDYNHEGLTPLMMCCLNGQHQCATLLVSSGAEINIRDQISGRTALFHAAESHDLEMVQLLLNHLADTRIKNFFGTSPHDAMYEIEDIPDQIKSMILGKNNKRKAAEEPRSFKLRKEDTRNNHSLKTYARFQKINTMEMGKKLLTSVK